MNETIQMCIFLGVFFVICGPAFWWLSNVSHKFYEELKKFRTEAFNAETIEELENVAVKLKLFYHTNWFPRQHAVAVTRVYEYVRGRIDEKQRDEKRKTS